MKLKEYIKLGECAICPYSSKERDKKIQCNWDDDKPSVDCSSVKSCGSFPKDISQLELE